MRQKYEVKGETENSLGATEMSGSDANNVEKEMICREGNGNVKRRLKL